jgi:hypothetical protein
VLPGKVIETKNAARAMRARNGRSKLTILLEFRSLYLEGT